MKWTGRYDPGKKKTRSKGNLKKKKDENERKLSIDSKELSDFIRKSTTRTNPVRKFRKQKRYGITLISANFQGQNTPKSQQLSDIQI
jgi:hypothetical protein